MASPPEESKGNGRVVELEEIEGDVVATTDYIFENIGQPVPVLKDSSSTAYDFESPPSQALAVSERFELTFAAHPSGFYAVRTKDVIDSAKEIKEKGTGLSLQELSVVDLPIGKVHILALSVDSSTLAVGVGGDIHLFAVDALLKKELKPAISCSLDESSCVKDIRWSNKPENAYVALSNQGELYHGGIDGSLNDVMNNIDAVEWSIKGKFIAVARKDTLSILSSKYEERLKMSLSFKSWSGNSDDNSIVKVDTIRWVRPDCIVLGCFRLTADGNEENYVVQVLKSKEGSITNASSQPAALSFYDIFPGLVDDIVPSGRGPYLFFSYLDQCELAIAANVKNTDQHIALLDWSRDDLKSEVAVLDIERDTWLPRIELQDNGDDNLIVGLCIDKVSVYGKVKVQLGVDEEKELSPYCILMCLTLEGKLVMFNLASATGYKVSPGIVPAFRDEEDTVTMLPAENSSSKLSSDMKEQNREQVASLQDVNRKEIDTSKAPEIPIRENLMSSEKTESSSLTLVSSHIRHKDTVTVNQEMETKANPNSFMVDGQQKVPAIGLHRDTDGHPTGFSSQKFLNSGQSTSKTSAVEGYYTGRDSSKLDAQRFSGFRSSNSSFVGKAPTDTPSQLNQNTLHKHVDLGTDSLGKNGPMGLQSALSQSWSGGKTMSSGGSDTRSQFLSFGNTQGKRTDNIGAYVGGMKVHGNIGEQTFKRDVSSKLSSIKFSSKPAESGGQKTTGTMKVDSLASTCSSQILSKEEISFGNSNIHKTDITKDEFKLPTPLGMVNCEPNRSKQFGNIKDMTRELDMLLESIEKDGGFKDSCTVLLKSSVETLETGIRALSDKCRIWKDTVDERVMEIQCLLDKTVEGYAYMVVGGAKFNFFLARKIYIGGIVKQASDSKYWDLWDRQKLSSELELKQRHILQLNQDITNQLIELERHFNTLELNEFGENGEVHAGRRALQSRFGSSRRLQSLHSLHNTMTSQLAAAEQLCECLSRQMALLNIESPAKQKNIKKELFETIGISYDASFSSPDLAKNVDSSSMTKILVASGSATKDQCKRRHSSGMKSSDSETARRRRDSLDRSWASFEPPKTTVKRILLQDSQKARASKSSSLIDKQLIGPYNLELSAGACPKDSSTQLTISYTPGNKGVQDTFLKQASEKQSTLFRWANEFSLASQSAGKSPPIYQTDNVFNSKSSPLLGQNASLSASKPSAMPFQNPFGGSWNKAEDKSGNGASQIVESEVARQAENNLIQNTYISTMLPSDTMPLREESGEFLNLNGELTLPKSSTIGSVKPTTAGTRGLTFGSGEHQDSPNATRATAYASHSPYQNVSPFGVVSREIQPSQNTSSFPTFSVSSSTSSSATINSSSSVSSLMSTPPSIVPTSTSMSSFSNAFTGSRVSTDANQNVSLTSSFSQVASSSDSFSPQAVKTLASRSMPSFSLSSTSVPHKTELQTSVGKLVSKTDGDTTIEPSVRAEPPRTPSESSLNLETVVSSTSTSEIPSEFLSESWDNLKIPNTMNNTPLSAQIGQPSAANIPYSAPVTVSDSTVSGKNDPLEVAVAEDEMEEEAPEVSHATELSLGGLGSFGLGSTSSPNAPKANPFGGVFGSAATNPISSPFPTTVPSGELFRPASFTFQPPQPSPPSQQTSPAAFSGGFGAANIAQAPTVGFGQPSQIGAGQQALGSVLGSFGQSRQLGTGFPGANSASASGFGGGFANAATAGGFAGVASTSGGFAGLASGGGGFVGAASAGGGFGGFAGAASAGGGFGNASSGGGGFGAFSSQGPGGFSAFSGGTGKPPELFTQIRK
ncbi:nuclear pore complex protein NUP214 isoform X1 [Tripterygium wilfordii]|uniref:nuclear pore complex protein NUP214 isoform X1 n=1 Tax=Tripterygium wilfordii TaxID=458696 RepID=UPI0018F7FF3A|nr:nuclear pore complex protein NUP214 isoform X1 [Tripterygium wilfordii]